MLPGHYLSGTKVMRHFSNFLMREAMNAILGRFRLFLRWQLVQTESKEIHNNDNNPRSFQLSAREEH